MKLAKVIGTVVATRKEASIDGLKILIVQPLDDNLKPAGEPFAAIDTVGAGPDELVFLTLARESTLALPEPFSSVDAAITGIVDQVNREDLGIVNKEAIFSGGWGQKK